MTSPSKLSQEIAAKLVRTWYESMKAADPHHFAEHEEDLGHDFPETVLEYTFEMFSESPMVTHGLVAISEAIAPLERERDELKGEVAYNQLEAYKENKRAETAESQLSSLSLAVKELHPFLKHTKECNITTEYKVYSPVSKGIGLPVWEQQPCNCGLGAAAERARTLVKP